MHRLNQWRLNFLVVGNILTIRARDDFRVVNELVETYAADGNLARLRFKFTEPQYF
jgi:hypothetical protein